MRTKSIVNAAAGGTTGFLAVITAVRWVLGLIGDAQTAADVADAIRGTQINWPVIYVWLIFVGVGVLIANNFSDLARWWRDRSQVKDRRWNMQFSDAVRYIVWGTHFGLTLRGPQQYALAGQALQEMAASGRLLGAGRDKNSASLRLMSKREWRRSSASVKGREVHGQVEVIAAVYAAGTEIEIAQGIMFNRDDVHLLWPQLPNRF
jgi:hypothetical protein